MAVVFTSNEMTFKNHGSLLSIFKGSSRNSGDYILQFADLSLHFIQDSKRVKWVKEESLSQIK